MTAAEDPDERCIFCGEAKQNMHHVTGRVLDVKFLAPLCLDHHKLIHDDWHTTGVGKEDEPHTFLERLAVRLTRLGMFLGRVALTGWGGVFVATLAGAVAMWAARMRAWIAVMDHRVPGWRDWPEAGE